MKILFEHNHPLPIQKYGGTERIIFWHMLELKRKGHDVYFIGPVGSDISRYGINFIPRVSDDWRSLIPKNIDIIHLFAPTNLEFTQPFLLTVEGNGQIGEIFPKNTVFVSRKHAANHGSNHYVYNGLDLSEYPYRKKNISQQKSWNNFLFLAKASWKVKNLKDCISVIKDNNKKLHVAGGKKFSFSKKIKYYGMVGQETKIKLLNQSDALLFPVRWHEPFGIAIIEAMAFGLPVIGSTYGSLPELIPPEVGITCKNFNELNDVIAQKNNNFDPDEIRNYIEQNFSISIMTNRYLEYYQRILSGETLNPNNPTHQLNQSPESLLEF